MIVFLGIAFAGTLNTRAQPLEQVVAQSQVVVRGVVVAGREAVEEPVAPEAPGKCGTYPVALFHLRVEEVLLDRIGAAPQGTLEIRSGSAEMGLRMTRSACLHNTSRSVVGPSYEGAATWAPGAEVFAFLDKPDAGWTFAVVGGYESVDRRPALEAFTMTPAQAAARRHETPLVVAHRGASAYAPENTVAAYKKAIELGATVHETDVLLTADGEVVVMHDDTVDRTTGGEGKVSDLTLADIRKLEAGSWFDPAFAGEPVPTLAEVLRVLQPHEGHVLCVEIKEGAGIAPKIRDIVDATQMRQRIILFSFDGEAVKQAHALMPDVPALFLIHTYDERYDPGIVQAVKPTGATLLGVKHSAVDKALVDAAHAEGLPLFVYTANEPADVKRLAGLGVDALITNYPDRTAAALR